jgi:RND family efflux transporter MFP subunit
MKLLFSLIALTSLPATAAGFDCLIEPRQVVELRSPVEGLIDKVNVERGGNARKGQVLVELASAVERANLAVATHRAEMTGRVESARNRVDFSQRKMARTQKLISDNFISVQARDEAETELRLAESELKDAQENQHQAQLEVRRASDLLEQRMMRAPFDGYVLDRLLNPGDLAEAGTGRKAVLKLAQLNPLRVEVSLPQSAYGQISVGSTAKITAEGQPGPLTAKVLVVDKVIDAASGLFGVRLDLPNPANRVPAGARCSVEFSGLMQVKQVGQGAR